MSVEANPVTKAEEFPLRVSDLQFGQIAQADNGDYVFVVRVEGKNHPVSLASGIGGYTFVRRYRLLPNWEIRLVTNFQSSTQ